MRCYPSLRRLYKVDTWNQKVIPYLLPRKGTGVNGESLIKMFPCCGRPPLRPPAAVAFALYQYDSRLLPPDFKERVGFAEQGGIECQKEMCRQQLFSLSTETWDVPTP